MFGIYVYYLFKEKRKKKCIYNFQAKQLIVILFLNVNKYIYPSTCSRSKRIDVISRITFPLVFALFNLVYWSTYLFREKDEE